MTDQERLDNYANASEEIIKLLPQEPVEALSILCSLIDMYGAALKLQHEETWKMVMEVKEEVFNELGDFKS